LQHNANTLSSIIPALLDLEHQLLQHTDNKTLKWLGLKVRRYAPVWYTGTSFLVGLKSYQHFFLADCHTSMP